MAFPPPWNFSYQHEYLACREATAVFDMSYFGKFYLVGLDARKVADWLFSADLLNVCFHALSGGQLSTLMPCLLNPNCYTETGPASCPFGSLILSLGSHRSQLIIHPQQSLSTDCVSGLVLPFEGSCHLAVGRAVAQHNLSHITTVLQDQKFRCQLIDSSEDLSMVSIQGPASSAILQEGLDTHLSNEAFPFSTHKFLRASRHLVRATWLSFTGELGWGLHIPKVSCMPVYQAVMATGAKHDLVNAGHHAIDSLSIEKGSHIFLSSCSVPGLEDQEWRVTDCVLEARAAELQHHYSPR
ncbi:sarcosine dehydrogenase, mitochondrial-like [Macaca fascicularis]|uniref:sarcosine dehydrogenase, mitochondrial-like n=1 Tax=Macaca fascicularis TaxID=9541 RepID=UPI0032B04271